MPATTACRSGSLFDGMSELASTPCSSKSTRRTTNGVDRVSSLPDELLHHMMSFLPMPEVVRTSLLSTRWRNLWASTPYIRINHHDFKDYGKLKKFGDHLLLLRDGATSLDEARILANNVDTFTCCEWVRHAIMQKARHLHVSGYALLDSTAMFPAQHLKTIRLRSLVLRGGFVRLLNCECPVLEHLEIEQSDLWDLKEISSWSLKVLHLIRCLIIKGLVICASNLTHLSIDEQSCHSGAVVTRDLSSLVTASIRLRYDYYHTSGGSILDYRLLDGLSNATTLELHAPLPELTFERDLLTCLVFSNLTSLVLGDWCMAADLYPLRRILHRSPKLKELSIKLEMEECRSCKKSESALPLARGALPSGSGSSHPFIETIIIHCQKKDSRGDALLQALKLIAGNAKISIERR
ncbi:hypothetical protein VPH35_087584 [Triticum aestivum]|uniref:F-box/FBD/LRR-repeat protein At5g22660-like isoform X1 n=2 Tax=Triticum aestivum TaxID=4565 RepID=UPI001D005FE1|nr:F-box/FBD/LRR-repeat protein At5g22660-like isoform X1 [Triticum aestivum]